MSLDEWYEVYVLTYGRGQIYQPMMDGEMKFLDEVCKDVYGTVSNRSFGLVLNHFRICSDRERNAPPVA